MTLDDGANPVVTLPDSMEWVDEFQWSPIGQDKKETIGGGLVVSESSIFKGRPITLAGGKNVWIAKSVIDALYALFIVADKSYTLTLADGRAFTVMFDRTSDSPFNAKQLLRKNIPVAEDKYTLELKLMEV